ncbi:MAG: hypothetical protein R3F20_02775 [Planctomycetota bacterium]
MRSASGILVVLGLVVATLAAPRVRAQDPAWSSPEPVAPRLGERVRVVLSIDDAEAALGPLPSAPDLALSFSPARREDGGRTSWEVLVSPRAAGRTVVPSPAIVRGDGRVVRPPPLALEVAEDAEAARDVSLTWRLPARPLWVGETFTLELVIGVASDFRRANLLQTFRQPLDLPLRLDLPALDDLGALAGLRALAPEEVGPEGLTLVVDDRRDRLPALEPERRDGRDWDRVVWRRRFVVERPGEGTLPAALVRFARATRFEEDFIRGRVPVDRRDGAVAAPARPLERRAPPRAGRPEGASDLVGRFEVATRVEAAESTLGEPFLLHLTLRGASDLSRLEPPAYRARGFVVGAVGDRTPPEERDHRRDFVYELRAREAGSRTLDPLRFASFDPEEGRWVEFVGPAYPVVVHPDAAGRTRLEGLPPEPETDVAPSVAVPLTAPPRFDRSDPSSLATARLRPTVLVVLLALPPLVLFGLALARRRRAWLASPAGRARGAAGRLRRELAAGEDGGAALTRYLADRFGIPSATTHDGDLAARLAASGLEPDLAARLSVAARALHAPRYGASARTDATEALDLVDRIEARRTPFPSAAVLFSLLVLATVAGAASWEDDSASARARRAWDAGRIEEALEILDAELATTADAGRRAAVERDRGACLAALERWPEAILAYRRAERVLPDDAGLARERRRVERTAGLRPAEPGPLARGLRGAERRLGPLGSLLCVLVLEILGLRLIRRRGRLRAWGAVFLLVAALGAGRLLWPVLSPRPPEAVVMREETGLRSDPQLRRPLVHPLPAGRRVEILEASDRWARVRVLDRGGKREGWIPRDALTSVD